MRYLIPSCVIAVVAIFTVHADDEPVSTAPAKGWVDLNTDGQAVPPLVAVTSVGDALVGNENEQERKEAITAYLDELQRYGQIHAAGMTTEQLIAETGLLRVKGQLTGVENELSRLEISFSILSEYRFEGAESFADKAAELKETLQHIRIHLPEDAAALKRREETRETEKRLRDGTAIYGKTFN